MSHPVVPTADLINLINYHGMMKWNLDGMEYTSQPVTSYDELEIGAWLIRLVAQRTVPEYYEVISEMFKHGNQPKILVGEAAPISAKLMRVGPAKMVDVGTICRLPKQGKIRRPLTEFLWLIVKR